MAHLYPIPFADLARRMCREAEVSSAVFDLPERKWWVPDPALDLSAVHFSRRASTPVGPAAGPQTQLAQNILLAWRAGGRVRSIFGRTAPSICPSKLAWRRSLLILVAS